MPTTKPAISDSMTATVASQTRKALSAESSRLKARDPREGRCGCLVPCEEPVIATCFNSLV